MIVAKFGGTAVIPSNLIHLKRIVTGAHRAVVVSAVGKEFREDVKVTDRLYAYFDSGDECQWGAVADKYRRLVEVNGISIDIDRVLADAHARARRHTRQYCASLGEELSARVVAAYLGADYIEAEEVVRFDSEGNLLPERTREALRAAFASSRQGVMGGFYGGSDAGRSTFSRGGGDVSGALVAAALGAELYENWTDVNGVCVADPVKVHCVATVPGISYAQMRLLSLAGAEVLHPDAVEPCRAFAIPIKIGNFFRPEGASTLVSNCPSADELLSVAEKRGDELYTTTILHSYPLWRITRYLEKFFRRNTCEIGFFGKTYLVDPDIVGVELSDSVVRVYSRRSILKELYRCLVG